MNETYTSTKVTCTKCWGSHLPGQPCIPKPASLRDELAMKCPLTLKQSAEAYGMKLKECIMSPTHWLAMVLLDSDLRYQWADAMLSQREPDEAVAPLTHDGISEAAATLLDHRVDQTERLAKKIAFKLVTEFDIEDGGEDCPIGYYISAHSGEAYGRLVESIKEVLNSEAN